MASLETSRKKRIISDRTDVFDSNKLIYSGGKSNVGDTNRNLKAEIGIWNGNLELVLKQADLCCIPVLIMKGVGNCGSHWNDLQSNGFRNWQTSCSMFLSYEYCGWGEGRSEQWLGSNTYQTYTGTDKKLYQSCPEYGVHWKDENGIVLNVGKFTDSKSGITTGLGLEPSLIEGVLSGYFSQLEQIDIEKCIVAKDNTVSFRAMGANGPINNASPYKIDYNIGAIYTNPDNLRQWANKSGTPTVVFYQNYQTYRGTFVNKFQKMSIQQVDDWKNKTANICWGYVTSKESIDMYERAKIGGEWQKWIGNLEKNTSWENQPFLIKVYDPDRNVDNSFSFDQINAYITKNDDQTGNFVDFFRTQLSDYYNGVTKKEYYEVTFQDHDGSQLGETQTVEYGHDATPPQAKRTGYVFVKWDPDYHSVTSDITCTAKYNKISQTDEVNQDNEVGNEQYQYKDGTVRIINNPSDIRTLSRFAYQDQKTHKLMVSNNVIGEILASKNENGLKKQITDISYVSQNVKRLSAYCFHGCENLRTLDLLSSSISYLGNNCFEGCTSLTSLRLPQNLESLNDRMFYGCTNLREITLNFDGLERISQNSLFGSNLECIFLHNMTSSEIYGYCSNMLVRFDKNDTEAYGNMEDIVVEFGNKWTCPKCEYTKNGYRFIGKWNTQPDGSGQWYVPNQEYQFENTMITLYAVWRKGGKTFAILETCMNSGYGTLLGGCKYQPKKIYGILSSCYDNIDESMTVHIMSDSQQSKVGKYDLESPTKNNILNRLKEGVNGEYDLVILYISDHGSSDGRIGVKGGSLSGKDVAQIIKQGDPDTRIMLICDMCHAESFSPFKASRRNVNKEGDFFQQMFNEFDAAKKLMKSNTDGTVNENTNPKILGWYTCDTSHLGWMGEERGMYFTERIVKMFSRNDTYERSFDRISSMPYWYWYKNKKGEYLGYSDTKPQKATDSAYHKKKNYNGNFDETQPIFR